MTYPRPPDEDINAALDVELNVSDENMELYLDCMNGKPMSQRTSDQELRNGCILTWHVYMRILNSTVNTRKLK